MTTLLIFCIDQSVNISEFDMYCGGCYNIPFWRLLRETQTYPTSITYNYFDGEYLSNLQPNNVTGCFEEASMNNGLCKNDRNGSVWWSCNGDWKCLVYMFCMISLQYIILVTQCVSDLIRYIWGQ